MPGGGGVPRVRHRARVLPRERRPLLVAVLRPGDRCVLPHRAGAAHEARHRRDDDEAVREAAAEMLGDLGKHAALLEHAGAIAARLEEGDWRVRLAAARALGALGKHAAPHAGAITKLLEDGNVFVRYAAADALRSLED